MIGTISSGSAAGSLLRVRAVESFSSMLTGAAFASLGMKPTKENAIAATISIATSFVKVFFMDFLRFLFKRGCSAFVSLIMQRWFSAKTNQFSSADTMPFIMFPIRKHSIFNAYS